MNRPLEILFTVLLAGLLFPLLVVLVVLVLFIDGSPVFFKQERSGLGGKPFMILKFRTMRGESPSLELRNPDVEKARLTRTGSFLRGTGLDELPQLWNVIRGEMSLVGPRPLPVEYLENYTDSQRKRLSVRPGITGWAQINGRNRLSWEEKFTLDVWYVLNRSLRLDLRILVRSVFFMLRKENILRDTRPFAVPFQGSGSTPLHTRGESA